MRRKASSPIRACSPCCASTASSCMWRKAGSRQIALRQDIKSYDFGFPAGVPAADKHLAQPPARPLRQRPPAREGHSAGARQRCPGLHQRGPAHRPSASTPAALAKRGHALAHRLHHPWTGPRARAAFAGGVLQGAGNGSDSGMSRRLIFAPRSSSCQWQERARRRQRRSPRSVARPSTTTSGSHRKFHPSAR